MKDIDYAKDVGKQLSGKAVCPDCRDIQKLYQELFAIGDCENELFCPHCDVVLKIEVITRNA